MILPPRPPGQACHVPGRGLRGAALGLCSLSPPGPGLPAIPREALAAPLGFRGRGALRGGNTRPWGTRAHRQGGRPECRCPQSRRKQPPASASGCGRVWVGFCLPSQGVGTGWGGPAFSLRVLPWSLSLAGQSYWRRLGQTGRDRRFRRAERALWQDPARGAPGPLGLATRLDHPEGGGRLHP